LLLKVTEGRLKKKFYFRILDEQTEEGKVLQMVGVAMWEQMGTKSNIGATCWLVVSDAHMEIRWYTSEMYIRDASFNFTHQ